MFFECFCRRERKIPHQKIKRVAIFIFYETRFPWKAWENNDKIHVIIRYSVGPNGLYSPGGRFQVHLLSDLWGESNILLHFKTGDEKAKIILDISIP